MDRHIPKGPFSHAGVFSRMVFGLSPVRRQHLCLPGDVKQPRNLLLPGVLFRCWMVKHCHQVPSGCYWSPAAGTQTHTHTHAHTCWGRGWLPTSVLSAAVFIISHSAGTGHLGSGRVRCAEESIIAHGHVVGVVGLCVSFCSRRKRNSLFTFPHGTLIVCRFTLWPRRSLTLVHNVIIGGIKRNAFWKQLQEILAVMAQGVLPDTVFSMHFNWRDKNKKCETTRNFQKKLNTTQSSAFISIIVSDVDTRDYYQYNW